MIKYLIAYLLIIFCVDILQAQTISWQDSSSNAVVYLHIDEADFKEHKHRTSGKFDVIETHPKYHQTVLATINKALRKYPASVINEHFTTIYVYDEFDKKRIMMGTYLGRHGFFFAVKYMEDGSVNTEMLERLIHHEFSHRLFLFESKGFDDKAWTANNTLKYGDIKSYRQNLETELFDKGFIYKYSVMNKLEDFSTFAENLFVSKPGFWEAIKSHETLRNKFKVASEFYESIDPQFNEAYFLDMHGVSLD
ncbi:putative zinc-binding metallopeptidase [Fulvivirga lutea]|uniref:Uncharacterized protein n=1 Tax=Fulvivirga lutea TaxID=2810512 RepID=A0A974WFI5_9BACT|nr:putative zinc-binding metallopeptidase [Fulvivirga lutea]QSE96077.1 hypothetical protein JR347_10660 [Fulvivirga lutea]